MRLPKPSEGGDFAPVPEGTWRARCYRFVDLGTQPTNFGEKHLVEIAWELKEPECVMREGPKAGKPMMIRQTYTWSMHEDSNLRKALETWRGKKFEEDKIDEFDTKNLLGVPCLLSVVHNEKGGKTYANVAGVAKPHKDMKFDNLVNPTVYVALTAEEFDREAFDTLSDKMKEKIMDSPEYQRLAAGNGASVGKSYVQEEEIPF